MAGLVIEALLLSLLLEFRRGSDVEFAACEVDGAKAEMQEQVEGLNEGIIPVENASSGWRERVGEVAFFVFEEDHAGAFAEFEGVAGEEIHRPSFVNEFESAGSAVAGREEACGGVVGCPEVGDDVAVTCEVDGHDGSQRRANFFEWKSGE